MGMSGSCLLATNRWGAAFPSLLETRETPSYNERTFVLMTGTAMGRNSPGAWDGPTDQNPTR